MHNFRKQMKVLLFAVLLFFGSDAMADVVGDCNLMVCWVVERAKMNTPNANRVLAIVHTAVYEAVNSITKRYPQGHFQLNAMPGASVDAAAVSAVYHSLIKLMPSQQTIIDSIYKESLAAVPDNDSKTAGIDAGKNAADAVLKYREGDIIDAEDTYRPYTIAGVYVPTVIPAVPQWSHRKPWLMTSPSQFRPGPPPSLTSEVWARDYNEIKNIGSKNSTARTKEQTEIARFWEATLPPVYHNIVHSVINAPGRDITQNAHLFAMITQAIDDALIAVMDAKYYYNFWRPVTAIRNGDIDSNDATERDPKWMPFIDTPMHPEYPCAHCIVSGAVGTILLAEIGNGTMPTLRSVSPTANGAERMWNKIEDFMTEVAEARIYDGVHFRNSTETGTAMGKQIGALAVEKFN